MKTDKQIQEDLRQPAATSYRFPVWQCPSCTWLNRYVDDFWEQCSHCHETPKPYWMAYIIDEDIRNEWMPKEKPTKVWVLLRCESYEGCEVLGVFDDEALAQKARDAIDEPYAHLDVEEFTLNQTCEL